MGLKSPCRAASGSLVSRPSLSRAHPWGSSLPAWAASRILPRATRPAGHIDNQGQTVSRGNGDGEGTGPHHRFLPAPGGHGGVGVAHGKADDSPDPGLSWSKKQLLRNGSSYPPLPDRSRFPERSVPPSRRRSIPQWDPWRSHRRFCRYRRFWKTIFGSAAGLIPPALIRST